MHIPALMSLRPESDGPVTCGSFCSCDDARALLELAPQHRYSLFPSFGDFYFDDMLPIENPYPGADVRYGPRHRSWEAANAFWARPDVEACLDQPDIVHSNNFWCPSQLERSRLVYTLYDLGFVVEPGLEPPRQTASAASKAYSDPPWRPTGWWRVSEASRAHYLRVFPHFPEDRIRVVHPCSRFAGVGSAGIRPKSAGRRCGRRLLAPVSAPSRPRKNQRRPGRGLCRLSGGGRRAHAAGDRRAERAG